MVLGAGRCLAAADLGCAALLHPAHLAAQLQPGDLVFSGNPVSHVGMYIGGGQMIHSPHTGDVVKIAVRGTSYGRIP